MQFAYQFPERCQRLVLVSSAGWATRFIYCCAPRRSRGQGLYFLFSP
jgi:hypothetical protein